MVFIHIFELKISSAYHSQKEQKAFSSMARVGTFVAKAILC